MKVLIMGWGDNIYIKRHIENVNLPLKIKTTLYTKKIENSNFKTFYKSNTINIINSDLGESMIYKIPKIRGWFSTYRDVKALKQNGPYDICHVHFVGLSQCRMVNLLSKKYKKLIISFWGSDLLRANSNTLKKINKIIDKADVITIGSEEMLLKFREIYGCKFDQKLRLIQFPTTLYTKIDDIKVNETVMISRNYFGLPKDKHVIVCGYNGAETHNHIEILKHLKKLEANIKDKIFLILPMTYGSSEGYVEKVNSFIMNTGIEHKLLTNYLNEEQISRLWTCADVFIHVQPTDGFSSSMRENLYAGTVIVNGSWLKYKELEQNEHFILKIDHIEQLEKMIPDIINNIDKYKEKSSINKFAIQKLPSNEVEYDKWSKLYHC